MASFPSNFEIIGKIRGIETIARNRSIRDRDQLNELYGRHRWRKIRGFATVRLENGMIRRAELHWYEAHGVGRRQMKIKAFLE